VAASIFGPLADAGINVDMIVQNVSEDGRRTDLTFTMGRAELDRALDAIRKAAPQIGYKDLVSASDVAKVSIYRHAACGLILASPNTMFKTLAIVIGINIQVITNLGDQGGVLIAEDYGRLAVRALHSAYGLGSGMNYANPVNRERSER